MHTHKSKHIIRLTIQPLTYPMSPPDCRLEDVGTGMRISLSLALPALSKQPALLLFLAASLDMALEREEEGAWTLTSTPTLLVTEAQLLRLAARALLVVSRCEASLQRCVAPLTCVSQLAALCREAEMPPPPPGVGASALPQSRRQLGALLSSVRGGPADAFLAEVQWAPGCAAALAVLLQTPLSAAEKVGPTSLSLSLSAVCCLLSREHTANARPPPTPLYRSTQCNQSDRSLTHPAFPPNHCPRSSTLAGPTNRPRHRPWPSTQRSHSRPSRYPPLSSIPSLSQTTPSP